MERYFRGLALLNTHSLFRYGQTITNNNYIFSIDEGGGEILVELRTGAYTLTTLSIELSRALNEFTTIDNNYETSVDYLEGKITVSGDASFSILLNTSSVLAITAFSTLGFTDFTSDLSGLNTYKSDSRSGFVYNTQFKLQGYSPLEDNESLAQASINIPASGNFEEVITYGTERINDMTLTNVTNELQPNHSPIRNNPSGVDDLRNLLRHLINKYPVEFCEDESNPELFQKLILARSQGNSKGTGYKIKELVNNNRARYYEIKIGLREVI